MLDLAPHLPTPVWGRDELVRRHVELQLGNRLAERIQRPRRRVDPPQRVDALQLGAPGLVVARRRQTLPGSVGREPASGEATVKAAVGAR